MTERTSVEASKPAAGSGGGVYGRIVTNFVHDMSTGSWAACLLVIWTISVQSRDVSAEAQSVLSSASANVFWLLIVSLAGLAVTGGIRLRYWREEAAPGAVEAKRTALIAKHIAFLLVYGAGSAWAWTMVFG